MTTRPTIDWSRVKELFEIAHELPEGDRAGFLDRQCAGAQELRKEVELLLESDANAGGFMSGPTQTSEPTTSLGQIGRYKLLKIIGEGGFGTVYLAEQEEPIRRRVAVKVIKAGMDTRAVIARFDAERQALAMMDHPNIARVFDAGETQNGRPYFVMELVTGVPVTQFCDDQRLSARQRLELFISICQAVQHAHQKGIIHRDLKPSNVLVTLLDDRAAAKVIDFGIAKATQARLTEQTLFTESGHMIGTPQYMSPEQAEATGLDIDTRSDIYSLGVMLYELLTGTTPLDAKEIRRQAYAEMQRLIREVDPPIPSARVSTLAKSDSTIAVQRSTEFRSLQRLIRGDLDWVVMKCLEKNRARRYDSAAGLAADLSRYLLDEPVSAARPSNLYRFRKYVRRHRVQVAVAAIVTLSLIGGAAASTYGLVREAHQRAIADAQRAEADHQRAQAQVSQRNAERQASIAKSVNDFLRQMLAAANPRKTLGKEMTVREAVTAAASTLDQGGLSSEPLVQAAVRDTIGETMESLGQPEKAELQMKIALDLQQKYGTPSDQLGLALATNDYGTVLAGEGHLIEAERLFRETLTILGKSLPPDHPDLARPTCNLGLVLESQARLSEAEPLFRRALAIDRKVPPPGSPDLAKELNNLADVLVNQGRMAEAEPLFREGLALQRKQLPPGHPDIAIILGNLANVLETQGKLVEAESDRREALAISRKALPAGHPDIARDLYGLAKILHHEGKLAEAESNYREALAIIQGIVPPDRSHVALILSGLAALLRERGDLPHAEQTYRQVVMLEREGLPPGHPQLLKDSQALAAILLQENKPEDAAAVLRDAGLKPTTNPQPVPATRQTRD